MAALEKRMGEATDTRLGHSTGDGPVLDLEAEPESKPESEAPVIDPTKLN
jgi:hypothetical protein